MFADTDSGFLKLAACWGQVNSDLPLVRNAAMALDKPRIRQTFDERR